MKRLYFGIFCLGACFSAPAALPAQENLQARTITGHTEAVNSVAFSTDGKLLASAGFGGAVRLWRLEDGAAAGKLKGHTNYVYSVAFSPDGGRLASASGDKTVKIWDVSDGSLVNTLKGHTDYVWTAVFFPDGERVASGGDDRTIKLWGIRSKRPYKTLRGHSGYVHSLAISPGGVRIASGGTDNTVKIWDAATGKCMGTLEGHTAPVNAVAFSPTGDQLASASDDGTVKIWELPTNACVKTFTAGGEQPAFAVVYSGDGTQVYSGGGDNAVYVHSMDSGQSRTLTGHESAVKALALSPDDKFLASGSFDKTIRIWTAPEEAEKVQAKTVKKITNFDIHYSAGLQLLASPTLVNQIRAAIEFKRALSYKQDRPCADKLNETVEGLKPAAAKGLKYLLLGAAALAALLSASRLRRRAKLRKSLPGAIRRETLSGSYETAMRAYSDYKAVGGKPENLPREEMPELYRGLRILEDLPKENLPYHFLLYYAARFTKEGNYALAQNMLRSGALIDLFKTPGEYEQFAGMYEDARRPAYLLEIKLKPSSYSALAEAFFRIGAHESCERICALKKQHYAGKVSARDNEMFSISRKHLEEKKPENHGIKWQCVNCGHVHGAPSAPEICPACSGPRSYFKTVSQA